MVCISCILGFSPAISYRCLFSSCFQCERDFLVMTMPSRPQTEIGGSAAVASSMKGHSDPTISPEIRRLRIKLQLGKWLACPPSLLSSTADSWDQADPRSYIMDQAIEPAMRYVQKIKQRCDPDTYQQFLDILSDYHHMPDSDEVLCFVMNCWKPRYIYLIGRRSRGRLLYSSRMNPISIPTFAFSGPIPTTDGRCPYADLSSLCSSMVFRSRIWDNCQCKRTCRQLQRERKWEEWCCCSLIYILSSFVN